MVRLWSVLFFLRERKDRIDMPRGFMNDLKIEVTDEKFRMCIFRGAMLVLVLLNFINLY